MKKSKINLKPISGYREYSPAEQATMNNILSVIENHYSSSGAINIRTPLVERVEVLSAKGGGEINKEIYGLRRLSESQDGSAKKLGLRFDLTVPLARYVAQRQGTLEFPFRRQQIDHVYRGDRPGKGRFREFIQADFDVIGREKLDILTDAEPPAIIYNIFSELEIGLFLIRINNRKILLGFFESCGFTIKQQRLALSIIDKSDEQRSQTLDRLVGEVPCSVEIAEQVIDFLTLQVPVNSPEIVLDSYRLNDKMSEGIDEICTVVAAILAFGVPQESLKIDLSVARGLDYYTGTVYETILLDYPDLGSICSGGRYDDLTSSFTSGRFPGVGISIGVSRLMEAGAIPVNLSQPDHTLITRLDDSLIDDYLELTARIRQGGVSAEFYFEKKSIGPQLKYASKKGYGFAILYGSKEKERAIVQVLELNTGKQHEVPIDDIIDHLKARF